MPRRVAGSLRAVVGTILLCVGAVFPVYAVVRLVRPVGGPASHLWLPVIGGLVLLAVGRSLTGDAPPRRERPVLPSHYDVERYRAADRPGTPTADPEAALRSVPEALACSACGARNDRSYAFCRSCQTKLVAADRRPGRER